MIVNRCNYCNTPINGNKQGFWGNACTGCKISLTKMLRSGKHGHTYLQSTRERLKNAQYDWHHHRWIIQSETPIKPKD